MRVGGLGGAASGASDMVDDGDVTMHRGTAVSDLKMKKQLPLWSEGVCVCVCVCEHTGVCWCVQFRFGRCRSFSSMFPSRRQTPISHLRDRDTEFSFSNC